MALKAKQQMSLFESNSILTSERLIKIKIFVPSGSCREHYFEINNCDKAIILN